MVKSSPPVNATATNRRLAMFILIGLGLAALVAAYVLLFNPSPKPPQLPIYPGAQVSQSVDNGSGSELHLQTQGATLKQISAFYQKTFTSTGWIVLSDKVASTPDHRTIVYQSQDGQWGVTLDIDYQADRGVTFIDMYEQKL